MVEVVHRLEAFVFNEPMHSTHKEALEQVAFKFGQMMRALLTNTSAEAFKQGFLEQHDSSK